ncbi:MAG: DUF3365 domain-containing protein [Rivularia sp. (in: cyanobacteria)]
MAKINTSFHNAKINVKFNFLLILTFIVGISLSGVTLSNVLYQRAQYEISIQAELLMETMNSLRLYTQDHVNPLLKPKLATVPKFIPEAIPTFSVREVSRYLSKVPQYKDFYYKDATLNPTNPKDQADDFETRLIEEFKLQPQILKKAGFRQTSSGERFYTAHPFIVKELKCLECHSRPEIAPKSLIATYGERGFGWKLNDIVATQIVYVPSEEVYNSVRRSFLKMMGVIIAIFVAVILLINYLLKKVVIVRIRNIANTANAISTGDMSSNFKEDSKDEIGLLAIAFERMRASLLIAMDLIDRYR